MGSKLASIALLSGILLLGSGGILTSIALKNLYPKPSESVRRIEEIKKEVKHLNTFTIDRIVSSSKPDARIYALKLEADSIRQNPSFATDSVTYANEYCKTNNKVYIIFLAYLLSLIGITTAFISGRYQLKGNKP